MGSSNVFHVLDGTLGSFFFFFLHLCHVLDYVFSIFHFYEVVNCKLQSLWIGSGYINLCTFRHTIKVTDHHGDGAKVVPCELITFDYTHQSLEMSTCLASFDHSIMTALWLESRLGNLVTAFMISDESGNRFFPIAVTWTSLQTRRVVALPLICLHHHSYNSAKISIATSFFWFHDLYFHINYLVLVWANIFYRHLPRKM